MRRPAIVILISGRGSNMAALVAAGLPVTIAAVISDNPSAAGLELAQAQGISTTTVDRRAFSAVGDFETALAAAIDRHAPGLLVLAGFMRILSPGFTQRYRGRMINIHPSLLPSFTGLHTHRQALAAGVRVHGCSVHYVTEVVDHGPIIAQAALPVLPGDTEDSLARRVLLREHQLYPRVVRWWSEGRVSLDSQGRVALLGDCVGNGGFLFPEEIR